MTKKKRRQARRDFLLNRLNLSKENDEFEERKIRIKKILHDNWSKWPEMRAWLLEGKSRI